MPRANLPHCAPDELLVECWCRALVIPVKVIEVRRGATRSCGAPHCNRLHDQNRKAS